MLVFAGLAVLQSWPLARQLAGSLPGPQEDNFQFLWNFWWMREAMSTGASAFRTPYLFAPWGVDLTVNTHAALPAFVGATVFGRLGIVAALNSVTLITLGLNGWLAYILARRFTPDRGAALLGGVIFGTCAYISARLLGHFNLTSAFVLPLFVLTCQPAVHGSVRWGIATGVVMAATAFIDYHYVVYQATLGLCLLLFTWTRWTIHRRGPSPLSRRLAWVTGIGASLCAAVVVAIWVTGGFSIRIGSIPVSMRTTFNPLQIFWLLVIVSCLLRIRPRLRVGLREGLNARPIVLALAAAGVVVVLGTLPLLVRGLELIRAGDYVSQRYFWRSAPAGVDTATLVLGNPLHPLFGEWIRDVYRRFDLSPTESSAWLGVVAVYLAARALQRSRDRREVQLWLLIGVVFFVWGLGPRLMVLGTNTGLILPQALQRYLPIFSNARMPSRAMVVVNLAVAMLAAIGIAEWRQRSRRPLLILAIATCLVFADQLPVPFPMLALDHPGIYDTLRNRPEQGALCELPMGLADGLGEVGFVDRRILFYQSIHRRPITGGYISRLPTSVRAAYEDDPLFRTLLHLSGPRAASSPFTFPTRGQALEALRAHHVAFVMLNRDVAAPALHTYVDTVLPLRQVSVEGARVLYAVEHE